jgi:uncharacterized protein DUF3499
VLGNSGPRISRPCRDARAPRPPERALPDRTTGEIVTVPHRAPERCVSGAPSVFPHDNLTDVNVPRRCCRPGCPHYAVATLTFVYSDSTAVVGPLATVREPHSWDLCASHAGRITAPRGWELVRHAGPLPTHPDEDDLVALADAVREGGRESLSAGFGPGPGMANGFSDPPGLSNGSAVPAPGAGVLAPSVHRPATSGRRRGHLRVLPDPTD